MKHRTLSLAFSASLLLCVFACNESTSVAPIPPPDGGTASADPIDAGDAQPEASATSIDAGHDAGTCNGKNPGFVPPAFEAVAIPSCSSDELATYAVACGPSDDSPECLGWKGDTSHATCGGCILRQDGKGPLRYYKSGKFSSLNEAGCLYFSGEPSCAAATDAAYKCSTTACGDCAGGQAAGACYETVIGGDCKSFYDAQATCEDVLTGSAAKCLPSAQSFGNRLLQVITLMCGRPGDAGPADAAAD